MCTVCVYCVLSLCIICVCVCSCLMKCLRNWYLIYLTKWIVGKLMPVSIITLPYSFPFHYPYSHSIILIPIPLSSFPSPLSPVWLTTLLLQDSVAFLPVNPAISPMRNQGRQKLATLDSKEFCQLVTDVLLDTKRRQNLSLETGKN